LLRFLMLCAVLPVASRILAIGLATSPAVPIAIPAEQIQVNVTNNNSCLQRPIKMALPDITPGRPCFSAPLIGDWRSPVRPCRTRLRCKQCMQFRDKSNNILWDSENWTCRSMSVNGCS
jgi:hypothetical protein